MKYRLIIFIIVFLILPFKVVAAEQKGDINSIVNQNLKESTDQFVQNTSKDLQNYVENTAQEKKDTLVKNLQNSINFKELANSLIGLVRDLIYSLTQLIQTIIKDAM